MNWNKEMFDIGFLKSTRMAMKKRGLNVATNTEIPQTKSFTITEPSRIYKNK
jgi:hypothetical protein